MIAPFVKIMTEVVKSIKEYTYAIVSDVKGKLTQDLAEAVTAMNDQLSLKCIF
jgi:hypothetical protein